MQDLETELKKLHKLSNLDAYAFSNRDINDTNEWHFRKGAEWGCQKALEESPSWIDVNERLPNNLSEVIVHLKSGYVTTLNYGESNGFFNAMSNTNVSINNPVTHWMELPPFPNPIS